MKLMKGKENERERERADLGLVDEGEELHDANESDDEEDGGVGEAEDGIDQKQDERLVIGLAHAVTHPCHQNPTN
jgi:hypothetical protein